MDQPEKPATKIIYPIPSILEQLEFRRMFEREAPVEVELGSGDGSFIVQYAQAHPDINIIGVERLLGRLRKIERKGVRADLKNLRGLRIEASYFLEFLLPEKSVRAIHILSLIHI